MPLYEYGCSACGKVHEVMQKFSDAPLTVCPDCQGPVEKLISLSSFALKGSGWYTTDYKRKVVAPVSNNGEKAEKTDAVKTDTPAPTSAGGNSGSVTTGSAKAESPKADAAKPAAKSSDAKPAAASS